MCDCIVPFVPTAQCVARTVIEIQALGLTPYFFHVSDLYHETTEDEINRMKMLVQTIRSPHDRYLYVEESNEHLLHIDETFPTNKEAALRQGSFIYDSLDGSVLFEESEQQKAERKRSKNDTLLVACKSLCTDEAFVKKFGVIRKILFPVEKVCNQVTTDSVTALGFTILPLPKVENPIVELMELINHDCQLLHENVWLQDPEEYLAELDGDVHQVELTQRAMNDVIHEASRETPGLYFHPGKDVLNMVNTRGYLLEPGEEDTDISDMSEASLSEGEEYDMDYPSDYEPEDTMSDHDQ